MSKEVPLRLVMALLWLVVIAAAMYAYVFHRDALVSALRHGFSAAPLTAYGLYLVLGCLRGFTLVPVTTLVIAAIPFLPVWPLFVLTVTGILVSSASIYAAAGSLRFQETFERRHARAVARLRAVLEKRELPIIVGWSFFPVVPTDAIVYVCGTLRVNAVKCLVGVAIGEGAICAIYIFGGAALLRWLHLV